MSSRPSPTFGAVPRSFVFSGTVHGDTIFKLDVGETPEHLYTGDYQSQTGYVRSRRTGAPVGMKDAEWEDGQTKGGPEDLLENLIRSGYPWHILGSRLKQIDQQFKSVTEEYAQIHDSISQLASHVNVIRERQSDTPDTVRKVLREEASALQNRWLIAAVSVLAGFAGLTLTASSNAVVWQFLNDKAIFVGLGLIVAAVIALVTISRNK